MKIVFDIYTILKIEEKIIDLINQKYDIELKYSNIDTLDIRKASILQKYLIGLDEILINNLQLESLRITRNMKKIILQMIEENEHDVYIYIPLNKKFKKHLKLLSAGVDFISPNNYIITNSLETIDYDVFISESLETLLKLNKKRLILINKPWHSNYTIDKVMLGVDLASSSGEVLTLIKDTIPNIVNNNKLSLEEFLIKKLTIFNMEKYKIKFKILEDNKIGVRFKTVPAKLQTYNLIVISLNEFYEYKVELYKTQRLFDYNTLKTKEVVPITSRENIDFKTMIKFINLKAKIKL